MTDNKVLTKLIEFNKERLLDKQEFNLEVASMNILEELLEAHGVHDDKNRYMARTLYDEFLAWVDYVKYEKPELYKEVESDDELVDAFCDIQVFAFGEIMKLGHDPVMALDETANEILSRRGKIVDGKFTKDKSPEAQSKWYKANYTKSLHEKGN